MRNLATLIISYWALSRPRTQKKHHLDGDIFTSRQQVVGCSKDEIVRPRGHRIKRPKKEKNPTPGQISYTLLMNPEPRVVGEK